MISPRDLFRYQKKFDATNSYTKCDHDIVLYKWKFSDGYEKDVVEPVFFRFFQKKGKYSVNFTIVTNCEHPQTEKRGRNFEVKWYDILILRWLKSVILFVASVGGLWAFLNMLISIWKVYNP